MDVLFHAEAEMKLEIVEVKKDQLHHAVVDGETRFQITRGTFPYRRWQAWATPRRFNEKFVAQADTLREIGEELEKKLTSNPCR